MKNLITLSGLFFGMALLGASEKPLLIKSYTSGLVPPEYNVSWTCSIYKNRVVKQQLVNGIKAETTTPLKLAGDIAEEIKTAAKGQIVTQPAPTDGPITSWYAVDGAKEIGLQAKGSHILENKGKTTFALVSFLDLQCGK